MRRLAAIALLLTLQVGWVATVLQAASTNGASDESRLPPCCRRDGNHHCSMAKQAGPDVALRSAPSRCAQYPSSKSTGAESAPAADDPAIVHAAFVPPVPLVFARPERPAHTQSFSIGRSSTKRGPPVSSPIV